MVLVRNGGRKHKFALRNSKRQREPDEISDHYILSMIAAKHFSADLLKKIECCCIFVQNSIQAAYFANLKTPKKLKKNQKFIKKKIKKIAQMLILAAYLCKFPFRTPSVRSE